MNLDLFRSFLPLRNPIGFGAADFIELAIAGVLVALVIGRERFGAAARRLADRPLLCFVLVGAMPVVLRLALLPGHPAPTPSGADDFSYLLLADTLRHFRLANPAHPLRQFFETVFVLQEPRYASIFPLGQGLALALGWVLFGHPWAGVLISEGAISALCYWMLRGWTTPGWALFGGVLAAMEFGPLCSWMNCYWGGAVSAMAGCLVFGALPRLNRMPRLAASLLGAGLGLQAMTRPFEAVLLLACVALFFGRWLRVRTAALAILAVLPAVSLILLHDRAVTGDWLTMPYQLSRWQYGVPASFTFQPEPTPHRALTEEQRLDYEAQAAIHDGTPPYFARLLERLPFYRFLLYPPLYLAIAAFLLTMREWRFIAVAGTILIFALGTNFYPYFYPHYIAAITCLFVLASIVGLESLSRRAIGREIAGIISLLCVAQFLFWYMVHATGNDQMGVYEPADYINSGDPQGRLAVERQLEAAPGRQLVFVRYAPRHMFQEWIWNLADIDGERIVRALDLGAQENAKLQHYFTNRTAWLLEPDANPPRLTPYRPGPPTQQPPMG